MTSKEQIIVTWAKSKIGCGYVWGGGGYTLSQAKLDQLIAQYPDYVSQSKNGKWIGKQVFDCASFVRFALKEVGITFCSGASSQWHKQSGKWAQKGTIDTLPKDKVVILYRATSSTVMQHTGIYTGDGYFIDARGSASGVIRSKISSYKWTHWGIPVGLEGNIEKEVKEVMYQARVTTESGSLNFRQAPSSSGKKIGTIPQNTIINVLEATADWAQVEYDETVGYVMVKFLTKIEPAPVSTPTQKTLYLKIKATSKAEAETILTTLKNIANLATVVEE